ncbi:M48 family metallopeptidase [Parapedobacter tibetensis]|uniref:M48 family metallopeptidase n=1 Tax=Parapedobacter tibetensis TaxID=2972951 RepID=UPI00214D579A|nr:M48 family metallopeptidase [Parapedobacter tibetensis]
MQPKSIAVSADFKGKVTNVIFSLVLFMLTYLLLIGLTMGLTILCAYAGVMLVVLKPAFYTFMVGAGLISMGILVLIFLLKFILKRHTINRTHLVQVTRETAPELFGFISEIVKEVKTTFPKRIYLSSDVNASVFYDSSFWSMFFPVRKNLQIGIGLVNAVSLLEFKAILAHEFGHFSQKSMKVGSYVYHVNQIIYNLLYENESYESLVAKWAKMSGFLSIFVSFAVKLVQGIQWILRKNYSSINLTHMGLSREMEFHADEVAASVAGSQPLIASLLRLELANYALDGVVAYYNDRITDAVVTHNVYPQQKWLMNFLATKSNLPVEHGFPQVTLAQVKRYNKSKLIIVNQWASHPSMEERVVALNRLNIIKENETYTPAGMVFRDMKAIQRIITTHLFSTINFPETVSHEGKKEFIAAYVRRSKANASHQIFNGYYDNKSPGVIAMEQVSSADMKDGEVTLADLFGDDKVDLIYSSIAIENDRNALMELVEGTHQIQSFDYDGVKYDAKDCRKVIDWLEKELLESRRHIINNDRQIYSLFLRLATALNKKNAYVSAYQSFQKQDMEYEQRYGAYTDMLQATHFMQYNLPVAEITRKINELKQVEKTLKVYIADLMGQVTYQKVLTAQAKEHFHEYLSNDWLYFNGNEYDSYAIDVMYNAIQHYPELVSDAYFMAKKTLLDFKAHLLQTKSALI